MFKGLEEEIARAGWVELKAPGGCEALSSFLRALGQELGRPISMRQGRTIEMLSPADFQDAKPNSLSRMHGRGAFPLHTDYAHWTVPPRLIVLGCVNPGSSAAPTLVRGLSTKSLSDEKLALCRTAPFVVRNGRRSFYTSILAHDRPFIRFDQGCMKPTVPAAMEAAETFLSVVEAEEPVAISWESGKILIIDNWHALHGRGLAVSSAVSSDRRILRMCI